MDVIKYFYFFFVITYLRFICAVSTNEHIAWQCVITEKETKGIGIQMHGRKTEFNRRENKKCEREGSM